jgi:hypothetical protein
MSYSRFPFVTKNFVVFSISYANAEFHYDGVPNPPCHTDGA